MQFVSEHLYAKIRAHVQSTVEYKPTAMDYHSIIVSHWPTASVATPSDTPTNSYTPISRKAMQRIVNFVGSRSYGSSWIKIYQDP